MRTKQHGEQLAKVICLHKENRQKNRRKTGFFLVTNFYLLKKSVTRTVHKVLMRRVLSNRYIVTFDEGLGQKRQSH